MEKPYFEKLFFLMCSGYVVDLPHVAQVRTKRDSLWKKGTCCFKIPLINKNLRTFKNIDFLFFTFMGRKVVFLGQKMVSWGVLARV